MLIEGNSVHVLISTVWIETELPNELPYKRKYYRTSWSDCGVWMVCVIFDIVYFISKAVNDDGEHLLVQCILPHYSSMDHHNMYTYEYWFYDDDLESFATAVEWAKSL